MSPPRPSARSHQSALLVAAALLLLPSAALAQAPCDQSERRQLDFWIGSWRLIDQDGKVIARSRVSSEQGGCLLVEDLSAGEVSGHGITYFDPSSSSWRQAWIDNRGRMARYRGTFSEDRAEFTGEQIRADGSIEPAKMSLELAADGRVLHRVELSGDGGRTWEVAFDGAYVSTGRPAASFTTTRATAPPPTPPKPSGPRATTATTVRERHEEPPAAVPAPTPAPSSPAPAKPAQTTEGPQAVSRVAEISEAVGPSLIQMVSPMTLRLPLGPLDKLPRGYAWFSEETARYISQGTSMSRVRVTPEKRRGKVLLTVEVTLHSDRYSQRLEVDAALVPAQGGTAYATGTSGRFAVGRGTTNQASGGASEREIEIEIDSDTFERLFAAAERPSLEVTLTLQ